MNTNGRLAGQNGHGVRQDLAAAALTTGVSIAKPRALRNGIVLYGQVCASGGRTWYTVKKKRTGTYRFTYYCTCPGSFLGEHNPCRHIAAFKLVEAELVGTRGEAPMREGV